MALEYIPGDSALHRMDPRTKFFIFFCLVILTVFVYDPFIMLFFLFITLIMYRVAGIPKDKLMVVLKASVPAMFLFAILNYLTIPANPEDYVYFYLIPFTPWGPVTLRSTLVGISSGLRFVFFIILTRLITLVTPVAELLVALVKMRLPVEAAVALGIAFASVPLMINQFNTVIEAQKSRGAKFEIRNPIRKMRAYVPIIVPSIYLTILRGIDISRTIESRAFTFNPSKRTFRTQLQLTRLDYVAGILALIMVASMLILRLQSPMTLLNPFDTFWFDYDFVYRIIQQYIIPWFRDLFSTLIP